MSVDLRARLGGVLLVAIGLALGWFFLVGPLQAAAHGAHNVSYSLKAFVVVPFSLLFGAAFLVRGSKFRYRNDAHTNFTPLGWALFGFACLVSAAGFFWFQEQFSSLGYSTY